MMKARSLGISPNVVLSPDGVAHFADVAGIGRGFARFPAGDGALRYL